jgi:hypothetical protein
VATSLPVPAGLPRETASWAQTPLAVRQVVVHLLAVIQQQAGRIAALEAHLRQRSRSSDRPSRPIRLMRRGQPAVAARANLAPSPGTSGLVKPWVEPTVVIEVKPERCQRGQTEFPEMHPYY